MWRDLTATRALEIIHKNINIIIQQTLEEQADLERITDKAVPKTSVEFFNDVDLK